VLGPDGSAVPGAYAAGWAKRGAQGLLFGQKADAAAVVKTLLSDAAASPLDDSPQKAPEAVSSWLTARGVRFVTFADWGVLDALERAAGAAAGKLREKFPSIDAMFEALERARR
jgi:ferredoxin/flavodoxin---NADP+ reductase